MKLPCCISAKVVMENNRCVADYLNIGSHHIRSKTIFYYFQQALLTWKE